MATKPQSWLTVDVEDVDLEHVAGHRALHEDRAGDEVRPRPLHHRVERVQVGGWHDAAIGRQALLAAGREGRQRDGVARRDLQHRLRTAVQIAPNHVFRLGGEFVAF